MRAWNRVWLVGIVLWLAACGAAKSTSQPPAAATFIETPTPSIPVSTALSPTPPSPTRTASLISDAPITLTLWVPEDFAPGAERGGDVLASQIAAFESEHPNIQLNYVLKASYGKGGIVDWLTQIHELMPERLPDAAIVDSRELDVLDAQELLKPLNRDLPSGTYWDLFSPAQTIAKRQGKWLDQPLVLETEHLVYDSHRVPVPPTTWDEVLGDKTGFAFAADSTDTFLFHYLESGSALSATQQPTQNTSVTQSILDYYQRARANGILNETTAGLQSARDVLPLFLNGQTPMAQVRVRDYLVERARLPNAVAAAIPTRDGRATALVSGWSFVMFTADEARQRAVLNYLEWLSAPDHLGEWASAAKMIPASKSAFAQAIEPQAYADLLWSLLQSGIVAPSFQEQAPYADAWHAAVQAVLNGQLSPEDAAFRAVQAITQ